MRRRKRKEQYGNLDLEEDMRDSMENDTMLHKGETSMKTLLSRDSSSKAD